MAENQEKTGFGPIELNSNCIFTPKLRRKGVTIVIKMFQRIGSLRIARRVA